MAGLKKSKKHSKRKSTKKLSKDSNKRSKRNIKTINKHTRKNKKRMIGGVLEDIELLKQELAISFKNLKQHATFLNLFKIPVSTDIPIDLLSQFEDEQTYEAFKDDVFNNYLSNVPVDGFSAIHNNKKEIIYDSIVNLIVEDPLLFIANYERIINKSLVDLPDDTEYNRAHNSYKTTFNYELCNFLAEFYEGDMNVYDEEQDIDFNSFSVRTLVYFCISHLCYIAKELVKNKLIRIYNSFITSDYADETKEGAINLLGFIDDNNYVIPVIDEREEEGPLQIDVSADTNNKYTLNPSKINMHDILSIDLVNDQVFNLEQPNNSFIQLIDDSHPTYDEINDIEDDYTMKLALYEINKITQFINQCVNPTDEPSILCNIMMSNPRLVEKMVLNCNHAIAMITGFGEYIGNTKSVIYKIHGKHDTPETPENKIQQSNNWILKFASSLAKYENEEYKNNRFKQELYNILSTLDVPLDESSYKDIVKIVYNEEYVPTKRGNIFDDTTNTGIVPTKKMANRGEVIRTGKQQNYELLDDDNPRRKMPSKTTNVPLTMRTGIQPKTRQGFQFQPQGFQFSPRLTVQTGGSINDDQINKLILGHVIYDNSHDFDFAVYKDNCDNKCEIPIVKAKEAVEWYHNVSGNYIEGKENVAKEGLKNILKQHFSLNICEKSFDLTNTSALQDIQHYVKTSVINIDSSTQINDSFFESNKTTFFYHDQGGIFTMLMFKNQLPKSLVKDEDDGEGDMMYKFQQSSLLKAWDSSSGGTDVGNGAIRKIIKDKGNVMTATQLKHLTIAFNIHAFMSMTHYFATFEQQISKLFTNGNAVVPILQVNELTSNVKFDIHISFMNLNNCIKIRNDIINIQLVTYPTIEELVDKLETKKVIDPIKFTINNAYKQQSIASYSDLIYQTKSKFSVNAILTTIGLQKNDSRSKNTKNSSIITLNDFFNNDAFKYLNGIKAKQSYGFMIKHSGDQCQGYQTQEVNVNIYNQILNNIADNKLPTKHLLYTEDILAYCNAVFNGSNVFTIQVKDNTLTVLHSPASEIEITKELIQEMKAIYESLNQFGQNITDADGKNYVENYKKELEYFKELVDVANTGTASKDDKLTLITKVKEFNEYISDMEFLKSWSDMVNKSGKIIRTFPTELAKFHTALNINTLHIVNSVSYDKDDMYPNVIRNLFIKPNTFSISFVPNVERQVEINESEPNHVQLLSAIRNILFSSNGLGEFVNKLFTPPNRTSTNWFNNLIKHLTDVLNNFTNINTKLVLINTNQNAYRLFNNGSAMNNFKSLNDQLYASLEIVKRILTRTNLNTPELVFFNSQNRITKTKSGRDSSRSMKYDISITSSMMYYLIKTTPDLLGMFTDQQRSNLEEKIRIIDSMFEQINTTFTANNSIISVIKQTQP